MTIEVTDADVEAVEAIIAKSKSDRASNSWECVDPKEIIAAAWAVMSEKHGLEAAIEEACRDLPEDYEIRIWVESGWAGVECFDPDGNKVKLLGPDCLESYFREALQAAIEDSRK